MAKSLRSKWKRKMKAVKRERYGEKELAMLKTTLKTKKKMKLKKIVDIVFPKRKKTRQQKDPNAPENLETDVMDVDSSAVKHVYNSKLKDENGNFPPWVNQRKAKKLSGKANSKSKNKKGPSTW